MISNGRRRLSPGVNVSQPCIKMLRNCLLHGCLLRICCLKAAAGLSLGKDCSNAVGKIIHDLRD